MATVLVTQSLPGGLDRLEGTTVLEGTSTTALPRERLRSRAADADAIVCMITDLIDQDLLAVAPRLRVVATVSVGYDHVDVEAATTSSVLVCNTPGVLNDATAELAFGLVLMAARRCTEAEQHLRSGSWHRWSFHDYLGMELRGATLGLVGYGGVGKAVGRRATCFDMEVIHHTRTRTGEAGWVRDLEEVLERADVVSLHVPLTDETHHLIGERELAMMKPTAILVNTSRGPVVDEGALAAALHHGTIRGAGIDVYEREPLVHPALLTAPGTTLLPHIGSATVETRTAMARIAIDAVLSALHGRIPSTALNPEAWE